MKAKQRRARKNVVNIKKYEWQIMSPFILMTNERNENEKNREKLKSFGVGPRHAIFFAATKIQISPHLFARLFFTNVFIVSRVRRCFSNQFSDMRPTRTQVSAFSPSGT